MRLTLQTYGVGSLDLQDLRDEIASFFEVMRSFPDMDPIDTMTALSAFTSRASQIRTNLIRAEDKQQQLFRTRELDPFINECDRQFKIWSRLLSARKLEWETSRGE